MKVSDTLVVEGGRELGGEVTFGGDWRVVVPDAIPACRIMVQSIMGPTYLRTTRTR